MLLQTLALLLALWLASFAAASKDHVVLGINSSTSKGFYYENGKLQGEYGEQLQCVIDELTIEFKKQVMPVARLVASISTGKVDIAVGLARTKQRDNVGRYSMPVMTVPYLIIDGETSLASNDDIIGKSIAVLRASNMVPMAVDFGGLPHELSNYRQVIQMVTRKRVDGALVPDNVFTSLPIADQQKLNARILKKETVGFYISLKSGHQQKLMSEVNQAIAVCHAKHKTTS